MKWAFVFVALLGLPVALAPSANAQTPKAQTPKAPTPKPQAAKAQAPDGAAPDADAAASDTGAVDTKSAKRSHSAAKPARPLPVVIPQQFAPPQEAYASFPESEADAAAAKPSACQARLGKLAAFVALPVLVGPGECGATDAVRLETITLPDQTKVPVTPPAILRCPIAEEITHWVRDDVVPSLKPFGSPLRELDNFDSYECRGRNRVRAAVLSEHGRADALDVRDFKLADGRVLGLTDIKVSKDWRETIKASVCARFSTVLGPGSDGYHEEHIHVDLAERRNNYKLCDWKVREPAPPPEAKNDNAPNEQASAAPPDAASDPPETAAAPLPISAVPLPRPRPFAANAAARKSERN